MNILSPTTQQNVEDELIADGLISNNQLNLLKNEAKKQNQPVFSLLLKEGHITDEQLTKALAETSNVPYVNLSKARINPRTLELLPQDIATRYMAVPLGEMQNRLVVAMLDADNVQAVDFLSNKIGRPLKVYAASESGIRHVLEQYDSAWRISNMLNLPKEIEAETKEAPMSNVGTPNQKIQTIVQDSPISKALSAIMDYAAKNRASDIHIEPLEEELKIRCRVDGVLREVMKLPKSAELPLINRIKILSN